jgi:O-methyltransferase domain/Dimerisation domain
MTQAVSDSTPVRADAREVMWDMITAYRVSQVVHVAAKLSLAEHCAAGAVTAKSVSQAEATDEEATARLLRSCAAVGLLTCTDDRLFEGTPLLDVLRRDADGSQWGFAMSLPAAGHWRPWGELSEAVRSGQNQTKQTIDSDDVFDYYARHREEGSTFFEGLDGMTAVAGADAARVIDTTDVQVVVDVGGATGTLLHELMALNPTLHGIVQDLPAVAAQAKEEAAKLGLDQRLTVLGQDFFESVCDGADIYLLRYVLHDWEDEACVRILRNCRTALTSGARLYVLEMVLGTIGGEDKVVPLQDLNMLAILHGKERSVPEFDRLFEAAGLRRTWIKPTNSPMSVMEVVAL